MLGSVGVVCYYCYCVSGWCCWCLGGWCSFLVVWGSGILVFWGWLCVSWLCGFV